MLTFSLFLVFATVLGSVFVSDVSGSLGQDSQPKLPFGSGIIDLTLLLDMIAMHRLG
jgi:hypothetical protein